MAWKLIFGLLIVSKYVQAKVQTHPAQTTFSPTGQVHLTTGFVHATIQVDITYYRRACNSIAERVDKQAHRNSDGFFRELQENIRNTCSKVFRVKDLYPHHREKRQLLALAGALTGTLFGGVALYQVHHLAAKVYGMEDRIAAVGDKLERVESNQEDIIHVIKLQSKSQEHLEKGLRRMESRFDRLIDDFKNALDKEHTNEVGLHLAQVILGFTEEVNLFNQGMTHLQDGNVATDLLPLKEARVAWSRIRARARKMGGSLVFDDAMSIYQLPSSYSIDANEMLTIITHVPVTSETLTLYSPTCTPVAATNNGSTVVLSFEQTEEQLAVSRLGEWFVVINNREKDSCFEVGSHLFCQDIRVLSRDFGTTCLSALYKNNRKGIAAHCQLSVKQGNEYVFNAINQLFAYSKEGLPFVWTCANGTKQSGVIKGQRTIQLQKGCTMVTEKWRVVREEGDSLVQGGAISHQLMEDSFFDHIREEEFHLVAAEIQGDGGAGNKIKEVLARIHQRKEQEDHRGRSSKHVWRLSGVALLVAGILVGLVGLVIGRWACFYRQLRKGDGH